MRSPSNGVVALTAMALLILAGGASPAPGAVPVEDELAASVTVLQTRSGGAPELCVGAVADSLPPQCGGAPIAGWDWGAVDSEETADGVTWGDYDVVGTWDGTTFTLTREPVPRPQPSGASALPLPWPDPAAQETVDRALADYGAAMSADEGAGTTGILSFGDTGGRVVVDVFLDDGTMQAEADATYGSGVVVIDSALRPVGEDRR